MKYKAIQSPFWKRKEGISTGPAQVSAYGAHPMPVENYELHHRPSIEVVSGMGKVTTSNYFYGKIIETMEEAEEVAKRLNDKQETLIRTKLREWFNTFDEIDLENAVDSSGAELVDCDMTKEVPDYPLFLSMLPEAQRSKAVTYLSTHAPTGN